MSAVADPLADLDPEQRRAVGAPRGPVAVIAGAGTGKTTTLTRRIAWLARSEGVDPASVMAVTHSTKAAGELRDRLGALGIGDVNARTFHSAALRILRYFWSATGHDRPLEILDSPYSIVRSALRRRQGGGTPSSEEVFDLATEIGWGKATLQTPASYASAARAAGRQPSVDAMLVRQVWEAYDADLEHQGKLDFPGLLSECTALLVENEAIAGEVRARYRSFLVDEYQDTDPLQGRFLEALLGGRDDLYVVGDPRQSIYAFRGAAPELLEDFTKRYPGATVVRLVRDYRSSPEIVQLANALVRGRAHEALTGQRPSGPRPRVRSYPDEQGEESGVANSIRRLLEAGTPAREVAVLYRFNAQSARFEAALSAAGVPYRVADSGRFFERPEIRDPLRAFGRAARAVPDEVGIVLLRDALEANGFRRGQPPAGVGAQRQRYEAQLGLLEMLEAIPGSETLAASALLAEVNRRAIEQHSPNVGGVTLATLHKAKGLEWDAVYLPGLTEGALPSAYAVTEEAIAEERRLLYVGITRARVHLELSWATSRLGANGATWSCRPSRFVDELQLPERGAPAPARARSGGGHAPRAARAAGPGGTCGRCGERLRGLGPRRLGRCPGCLEGTAKDLLVALERWREALAEEEGLSLREIATDRALVTLVALRPRTSSGLASVAGLSPAGAAALEASSVLA